MEFKFKAFISYSHQDKIWAEWLQYKLETYEIPPKLNLDPSFPWNAGELKTLRPVFRDETELPACDSLPKEIAKHLDHSYTLIVLCSPSSLNSRWVKKEMGYFQENHSDRRIIPVILPVLSEGNEMLETGNSDLQYLPPELLGAITDTNSLEMPLAAKFPKGSLPSGNNPEVENKLHNQVLKIIAGMLNISLSELIDRDKIYHKQKNALQNLPRFQEQREQAIMNFDLAKGLALSCLSLQCKEVLSDYLGAEAERRQIALLRSVLPKLCSDLKVAGGGRIANYERNQSFVAIEDGKTLTIANASDGQIIWGKMFTENTINRAAIDSAGNYLMTLLDNILINVYKLSDLSGPMEKYEVRGKSALATISCKGDIAYVNSENELWLIHQGEHHRLFLAEEVNQSTGIWWYAKFSHDGKYLAAASSKTGNYVAVWEIGDKSDLCGSFSFKPEDELALNKPVEIQFSPDSSLLAVRYLMESSFVYKLPDMIMLDPQPLQLIKPQGIELSADNTQILVNEGFTVSIIDTVTGQRYTQTPWQEDTIDLFGYIKETHWFYTVVGKTIKVWNITGANAQLCFHFTLPNRAAAVFTNKTLLTAVTEDIRIFTWNLRILPISQCLTTFGQRALMSGFCGNGEYAYTINDRHQLLLWESAEEGFRALPQSIEGCLRVSSSSTGIFCLEEGSKFSYIDFINNERRRFGKLAIHFPLDRIAISSYGHFIAFARGVGSSGGIISTQSGNVKNFNIPMATGCTKIVFSPDEHYLALGDTAGGVNVYNTDNAEAYLTIPPHFNEISGLAFSNDHSFLAICDRGKMVSVWEVSGKQKVYARKMEYQLREVIFEPSGRYLAALDFEARHIALIDRNLPDCIANLNISRIWGHNVTVQSMCFVWKGEVLLAGLSNGVFAAWNTKSGKLVLPFFNIDGSSIEEINYSIGRPLLFRTTRGLYYLDYQQTPESAEQIFAEAKLSGGLELDFAAI